MTESDFLCINFPKKQKESTDELTRQLIIKNIGIIQ